MKTPSIPDACLLSNGRYFVQLTAAGTGQSRRHGHVVNRWTGDPVEDRHGQFIYLRDVESGEFWSAGLQPVQPPGGKIVFSRGPGRCQIRQDCEEISAQLDVAVPPGEDLELRRLTLENQSSRVRRIEVTTFFEAVLHWQGADIGHPAFQKLFLQTSFDADSSTLLVRRRPRGHDETWPVLFHSVCGAQGVTCETDRLKFIGRGRSTRNPAALQQPLSGTVGNVLDPCCSLRTVLELAPGATAEVAFLTGIAESKKLALEWRAKYARSEAVAAGFQDAERAEQELWKRLGISAKQAEFFQSLAASIHYADPRLVPAAGDLWNGTNAADLFGKLGIPRDRPQLVLLGDWGTDLSRDVILARNYWNAKGCFTNLIVLTGGTSAAPPGLDDRVFTFPTDKLSAAEQATLLRTVSLVVKKELPKANIDATVRFPAAIRVPTADSSSGVKSSQPREELQFSNGYGGFSPDGSEYVIHLPWEGNGHRRPPLPWINVIASEQAGFLVSEAGAGCTWARNSQANRLTPWSNDPVQDPCGEALYLRDESTGEVWSPLPAPLPAPCGYTVRHGFGYSKFHSQWSGISNEVTMFVPRQDPLKIVHVRLTNNSGKPRNLSLTSWAQLVMGSQPDRPSLIVTRAQADGSLRARNLAAGDFRDGVVFSALALHGRAAGDSSWTGDRLAFLGRYGSAENPAALLSNEPLDGQTGAGLEACFAQQRKFLLPAGASADFVILLGEAISEQNADTLVARYGTLAQCQAALEEVRGFWNQLRGGLRVKTPDPSLDLMVNGWLVYQTVGCRIWGRTAFYQSGGAYGYRDQLQDAGNLMSLDSRFARQQILRHARHQFIEGDVLHWWHPAPINRGVRTKFSDDLLWLPLITAEYIRATGDAKLLSEQAPFLKAPLLGPHEEEKYLQPEISSETADVYEHCCRSIDRSLAVGAHGLPLMGIGDWNDGMNRIGREGKGESVWMGFFLYHVLGLFIPICQSRGDQERTTKYEAHRQQLRVALNDGGWDGEWYRRAYFDDGTPLGSKQCDECRIDVLPQSWGVISGAAPAERAAGAMAAAVRELVSEDEGLIRLLKPPFVNTKNDPGYIKGYVAGVRENGGQYTHAACWIVKAVAELGDRARAARLLRMLLPVSHALTRESADFYKVEPYSVAADVYGADPHIGRGGWTWYTGSSGWLYRVAVESVIGLRVEAGNTLVFTPCIPDEWPGFQVQLQRPDLAGGKAIDLDVKNSATGQGRIASATVNGQAIKPQGRTVRIPLPDSAGAVRIEVMLE